MRKWRILIMEDQMIIGEDLRLTLEERGYEVMDVVTDVQSLDHVCSHDLPDLILMDLPLHKEFETITNARFFREEWDVPVVFLTTCSWNSIRELIEQVGPCIEKPYSVRELLFTVQVELEKRKDNSE